jgi:hypothetical protein
MAMSRGSRWYVFGRKEAQKGTGIEKIEPGTVYVFEGWSRTVEAATARRDKLDRAGRAGIRVFSPSRQQAMSDIMEVYPGVVVDGYISPANKQAGRQLVRAAVVREIFCPYTSVILDMRRAVVIVTPTGSFVCTGDHWDERMASVGGLDVFREMVSKKLGRPAEVKVYDGRELFKR